MTNNSAFHSIGFIGLGLIGGSVAKAAKLAYPNLEIYFYDKDEITITLAEEKGYHYAELTDSKLTQAEILFLCGPVLANSENLRAIADKLGKDTLLTDVGSVKKEITDEVSVLGLDAKFIGGHPMAGSERIGFANSTHKILKNAYYILSPSDANTTAQIEKLTSFVIAIGALPLTLAPEKHDYVTAAISHLPHVISASLVNLVKDSDDPNGTMKMIAAGGFKDITRISSSSPTMWEHICMTNKDNILSLLDDYMASLAAIRSEIEAQKRDEIHDFFDSARTYRDSFPETSSGPIKKAHVFYVEIPDENGALATIVTLLAFAQISIKNISITHNREVAQGSLRMELYEEKDLPRAMQILQEKNYQVFQS